MTIIIYNVSACRDVYNSLWYIINIYFRYFFPYVCLVKPFFGPFVCFVFRFTILKPKLSTHKKEVKDGGSQSVLSKINLINT